MTIRLYYFSFYDRKTEFALSNNLTDYLHYIFSKGDFMPFSCMLSGHNISYEFSYDKDSNIWDVANIINGHFRSIIK